MTDKPVDKAPQNPADETILSIKQVVEAKNNSSVSDVLQIGGSVNNSTVINNPIINIHPLGNNSASDEQPSKPNQNKKLHNLPDRNRFFTGRVDVLNQLAELIKSNREVAIKQAISGMGGIGKTQTALEFSHRHINDYQTILWITAENEISFNNSYYGLVDLLSLASSGATNDAAGYTLTSDGASNQGLKVDEVISLVKSWLANNPNWLMVLDNLEDTKLIKDYLPSNHQGHVLITTRSQSLKGQAAIVQLKKMSLETATLFLLKRANLILIDANNLEQLKADNGFDDRLLLDAQKIVQAMDGLPLALEQAGAYIQESACSLADYLKAYQDVRNTASILDNDGEDANDHKSVYATFKLNFDVVEKKNVAAAKLLEVCSFLDSELIPEEIFTSAGNFLGDELAKLQDNNYEFNNCLKILLNYSLIERDTHNKSLSIHRLVQTVIRDLIGEDNKKLWIDSLAKAFASFCLPAQDSKNWPQYQRLLPSITSFLNFLKLLNLNVLEGIDLFHQFGLYCDDQALFNQSLMFYQQALLIRKYHFGDSHISVAATLNNIGSVYRQLGKYEEALSHFNKALSINVSLFGNANSECAGNLANIASIYDAHGQFAEALNLYLETLPVFRSSFGNNDPIVANMLNNVGEMYRKLNKPVWALTHFEEALSINKQHFGDHHFKTAEVLNNIALVYDYQEKFDNALDLYKQVFSVRKTYFGDNHPTIAQTFLNIGNAHDGKCEWDIAINFYDQALSIYKSCFGDNHPNIADCLNNIGGIYHKKGQVADALCFYQEALSIYKDFFGDIHHDTACVLNNIATIRQEQGFFPQALDYYQQALSARKLVFGENHHEVAESLHGIALTYQDQGNLSEALNYYQQALSIRKLLFGENHIDVAGTFNNIATIYQTQGNYPLALDFYNQALKIYKHLFGNFALSLAFTLNNIATIYQTQGSYSDALDFYNQSLAIKKLHLGNNHPNIIQTLIDISNTYNQQGNYPQAVIIYNQVLSNYKYLFGDNHPNIAATLTNIAEIYCHQGKYSDALSSLDESLTIRKHHFGDSHPNVADSLLCIGNVHQAQGNYDLALDHFNQSLTIYKYHFGDNHPSVAMALANIANVYRNTDRELEADNYYKQALDIFDKFFPPNHHHVIQLLFQYSQLLLKLNKPNEVQPLLDRLASLEQSP